MTWRTEGKSRSKAFASEAARDYFATSLEKKRERFGTQVLAFDPREWAEYLAFRKTTQNLPLDEIVRRIGTARVAMTMTVSQAIERFLAVKKARVSHDAYKHTEKNLGRLVEHLGEEANLGLVTADMLEKWISSLPFAPETVLSHFKNLRTLFNWAERQEFIVSNPVGKLDAPKVPRGEIKFLLPEQGRKLFEANKGLPVIGRLACEAFVGVRFSAAAQLRAEHINRADKGLTLWSKNDGGQRYIEGFPPTVWKWIKNAPPEAWTMAPRAYLEEKSKAFVRAGVVNEGNTLRHSFCTYHFMLKMNPQLTSAIAQNSPAMLEKHYKGRATSAQAKEWFAIKP